MANVPESQHAGMMLFSDHATPNGNDFSAYGCHTFKWVNAQKESVFVKVCPLMQGQYLTAVPLPVRAGPEAVRL